MANSSVYPDLPLEGKRKCLEDLDDTIQTLQKIKKDLKEADDNSPDKNVLQVIWQCHVSLTFTKEEFEKSFINLNSRRRQPSYCPCIKSVIMQDNFMLDHNKNLQPIRMCFVKFSTDEDACIALERKQIQVNGQYNTGSCGVNIEFILPTQSLAVHKTFRIIGNSLARLEEIQKELRKIGAVRGSGGMPTPKSEFVDKAYYATELEKFKAIRAAGKSLEQHPHGLLSMAQPIDMGAFKMHIKTLYDEECDILI